MQKPEMVIFDYGHTLLYQPGHSTSSGNRAIYPYIDCNPRGISFEEFNQTMINLFAKIKAERGILEIHEHFFLKLAMEYGAKSVGMFPVLYEGEIPGERNPFVGQNDGLTVDFEYLHIHDWREFMNIFDQLRD